MQDPPSRLRLDISYDGTDFAGWAVQPGLRTVAGVLTDALQTVLRHEVRVVVADESVDAGQAASEDAPDRDSASDQAVEAATEAPAEGADDESAK